MLIICPCENIRPADLRPDSRDVPRSVSVGGTPVRKSQNQLILATQKCESVKGLGDYYVVYVEVSLYK